jgi:RHS repeat-associated protein
MQRLAQASCQLIRDPIRNSESLYSWPNNRTKYSYDLANRLVSALIGTGSPQYVYNYDHASNLTSITPDGTTQNYTYTSTNEIAGASYDANGSPTVLATAMYKWDGANRIVRFTNPSSNLGTTFTYDGLGHLVRVVDSHAGTITADHSYFWCGSAICLAHDNTQSGSPVSTQYFAQGAIVSGTSYYYLEDELGGVRELVGSTGTVAAQYSYDPYGNKSTLSGTVVSDIGYGGYYYHPNSGLNFAMFRAYDSTHVRWLNRDPIGEAGGINLYAYAVGNPVSNIDSSGLQSSFGGFSYSPAQAQGLAVQQAATAAQSQMAGAIVNSVLPLSVGMTATAPTGNYFGIPTAAVFRYRHDSNGTMCSIGWGVRTGQGNVASFRPSAAYSASSFGDTEGWGWTNSVSAPVLGPFGYSVTSTNFLNGAYSSSRGPAVVGGLWSATSVLSYTVTW